MGKINFFLDFFKDKKEARQQERQRDLTLGRRIGEAIAQGNYFPLSTDTVPAGIKLATLTQKLSGPNTFPEDDKKYYIVAQNSEEFLIQFGDDLSLSKDVEWFYIIQKKDSVGIYFREVNEELLKAIQVVRAFKEETGEEVG